MGRVKRKSVLQPALLGKLLLACVAHKSFQLAPKPFLLSRIDDNPTVIWIFPPKNTCPVKNQNHLSPIAKSTSPRLLDVTFFARCGDWKVHIMHHADFFRPSCILKKKKLAIIHHINFIAVSLNPMIFTNHGSPGEKSHITHYENSNHVSCSHRKLFMPPSLCFTQNKLNYVKMTSFCFCFFSLKTCHIYHKFLYMLNLHVSCKFCCVSGVLHL